MSDSAERRIREFLAKYSPGIASELRAARARLRSMFPRGFELVYDNYNALVFGYSADDRASNVIVSIAGYPRWVTLFLLDGARLRDPAGLLVGAGKTVRGIRLQSAQQLSDPAVQA